MQDVDVRNKNVIPHQYQEAYKFEVSPLKAIGGDISNSTLNHSDHFDNSYNNIINNDFLSEIQNLSNNNITNDSSHLVIITILIQVVITTEIQVVISQI